MEKHTHAVLVHKAVYQDKVNILFSVSVILCTSKGASLLYVTAEVSSDDVAGCLQTTVEA